MGRHGYSDDCGDNLQLGRWRGQVASAIRGKRGQAFLRELVDALDAMPVKRLIKQELVQDGEFCTMGVIGAQRGLDLKSLDSHDFDGIADKFGIAHQLVQEIEWENDEGRYSETPEARWARMRTWAADQLKERTTDENVPRKGVE